jgi:hypothetical protein
LPTAGGSVKLPAAAHYPKLAVESSRIVVHPPKTIKQQCNASFFFSNTPEQHSLTPK